MRRAEEKPPHAKHEPPLQPPRLSKARAAPPLDVALQLLAYRRRGGGLVHQPSEQRRLCAERQLVVLCRAQQLARLEAIIIDELDSAVARWLEGG